MFQAPFDFKIVDDYGEYCMQTVTEVDHVIDPRRRDYKSGYWEWTYRMLNCEDFNVIFKVNGFTKGDSRLHFESMTYNAPYGSYYSDTFWGVRHGIKLVLWYSEEEFKNLKNIKIEPRRSKYLWIKTIPVR